MGLAREGTNGVPDTQQRPTPPCRPNLCSSGDVLDRRRRVDGRNHVSEGPEVGCESGVCPLFPRPPRTLVYFNFGAGGLSLIALRCRCEFPVR